ncbi:MAG: hypothetical protein WCT41_04120 [Candidatus Paceibacterota bacterium]|jgi:hypothetical protein
MSLNKEAVQGVLKKFEETMHDPISSEHERPESTQHRHVMDWPELMEKEGLPIRA